MTNLSRSSNLAICFVLANTMFGVANTYAQITVPGGLYTQASFGGSVKHRLFSATVVNATNIPPVDESVTIESGTNTMTAGSAQSTVMGIPIYSLTNLSNSTNACNTASCDQGNGTANEGGVILLGGLVTASNISESGSGVVNPDALNPAQAQITISTSIGQIGGTGLQVPSGTYPAGTQMPVSGMITVPLINLLGITVGSQQVQFTGNITFESFLAEYPNSAGDALGFESEAIRLQGTAPDGLGGSYNFDLKVGEYGLQLLGANQQPVPFSFQLLSNDVIVGK